MILKPHAKMRRRKIEIGIFKRKIEAQFVKKYFPKGDRVNRKMYVEKIEDNPAFKKQLNIMKTILYGKKNVR